MLAPRWKKVIRDLWDNKSRTLLIVFSVAIGVFAFGGLFIARAVATTSQLTQWRASDPADISFNIPAFDDSLVNWAAHQPNVTAAQGVTTATTKLLIGDSVRPLTLYAYSNFVSMSINRMTPETGSWPPAADELYIERSYAAKLKLKLGDSVSIELPDGRQRTLVFAGTVHDMTVRSGTFSPQVVGYVSPETMHRMGLRATYNRLDLRVDRTGSSPAPATIASTLRDDFGRMNIRVNAVTVNSDGKRWSDDIFDGLTTILVAVGLASLLLSAFLVINTISGLITQQKRLIGVMKIIGASREQIIGVYLVLVASFGALALVIALPASLALAYVLSQFIGPRVLNFDIINFSLPTYILVLEIVMAFLTPLLAALFPILSGTRISAAEAISDVAAQVSNNPIDLMLARLRGLSTPTLLAVRNTFRRKQRLFITAFTLVLAGAFFISILNVRNGLNVNLSRILQMSLYDVQVTLAQPYNAEGLQRRVLAEPGVVSAEAWTTTNVAYVRPDGTHSDDFSLIGLPQNSAFVDPPLMSGSWLAPPAYANRYDLVISDGLQTDTNLQVGMTFTLVRGDQSQDWHVVGVVSGGVSLAYGYYDTVANIDGTPGLADRLALRTGQPDDAFQQQVIAQVTKDFARENHDIVQTSSRAETIANLTGAFNILIGILLAMAILIAVVAGLGLAGTMSLNVLERTREIGVMRAVGAGNGSVRRIFVSEGILIGLLSCVISIPLSFPMTYVFGNILGQIILQQPLEFAPLWTAIAEWLLLVLLVSTLASVAPAQRAAQISIREAIAYE